MTSSAELDKAAVKTGWVQTGLILLGMIATVLLTFGRLDAKADTALATATRAEIHASKVEDSVTPMNAELVRIRTVLEERLPKK